MTEDQGYTPEVFPDADGAYRWRLVAANGQIVAVSGEGYVKASHAEAMVGRIFKGADRVGPLREVG